MSTPNVTTAIDAAGLPLADATTSAREANPYMTGLHSAMRDELTLENLAVTGSIPPALDGRYLRMGPNPMSPNPRTYHWFSGDGMIHGLRIKDGRALWYRNRFIRSAAVTEALGERRTPGPRHIFDTVNTNVMDFGGRTLGLVEAGSTPVEIGATLETLRYTDFGGTLDGGFSAHPHVDPLTNEMLAVCYEAKTWNSVRFVVVTPEGKVRRKVTVPVRHGPMMHDFAFTQRYAVILDLPVTFSLRRLISGNRFPLSVEQVARGARGSAAPRGRRARHRLVRRGSLLRIPRDQRA